MPNVPATPFRNQVVKLQALPSEELDPALALLCPVRALRIYVDRTPRALGAEREGCLQAEVVPLDGECRCLGVPISGWAVLPGVRAHSTRSVTSICLHTHTHFT